MRSSGTRRQAIRGAAQRAWLVRQQDRSEPDAEFAQLTAELRPILLGGQEMAPVRNQRADFFRHAPAQFGLAGGEGHHYGIRVLAQQAEDPFLEALFHSTDRDPQSTAHAASGVIAAMAATGV
jgi:hypothetical protein